MKKKISLSIAGTGDPQVKELELAKGTTKKDALKAAKVPVTYQVIRKSTGEPIREGQDLFNLLEENEVLIATPPTPVGIGRGALSRLNSFFEPKVRVIEDSHVTIPEYQEYHNYTEATSQDLSPISVFPSVEVIPSEAEGPEAELEDMGWKKDGSSFHGFILDADGVMHPAELSPSYNGYRMCVKDVPRHVFSGRHGTCFRPIGSGWYWVHFDKGTEYPPGMIRSTQELFTNHRKY